MDWISVSVNALVTILVGLALWAFLPRGVVLTRAGKPSVPDAWQITNDSPIQVRLTSVGVASPETVDVNGGSVGERDLPWNGLFGVVLEVDDFTSEFARRDWQRAWSGQIVEPGDTLTAHVPTNTTLVIDYRRAGWSGIFERRSLLVDGGI